MNAGSWMSPAVSTQPAHLPVSVSTVPAAVEVAYSALYDCQPAAALEKLDALRCVGYTVAWSRSDELFN